MLAIILSGCAFLTVNVVLRSTTDVGDGTTDSYTDQKYHHEVDTNKLSIPLGR